MKTLYAILMLLLILLPLTPAVSQAQSKAGKGDIILYTGYRQMGWGDSVQIGCIDNQGQVFTLEGHDASLKWPYKPEDQLKYLSSRDDMVFAGTLKQDDITSIRSLIASVADQGTKSHPGACDAGTEKTYAVRYDNGVPEFVLLGMSGDDVFENTDPNAQTLYWVARALFANVRSYYQSDSMGPQGFSPVPLLSFFNVSGDDIRQASIHAYESDCEAGLMDLTLSPAEESSIRNLMLNGIILRKSNALSVTGGFTLYQFESPDGRLLCTIDLYNGLLMTQDGMYMLEIR